MGCRVSKETPEESAVSATSHLPQAGRRCNINSTMCTFSAENSGVTEEKKERDRRSWRKCAAKDDKEAQPELMEKNKIVSDKKYCMVYNGASPSFGGYCRRNASVSNSRPTDEVNSSDEARETKAKTELAGKKGRNGRWLISRPAGFSSFLAKPSWPAS